MNEKNKLTSKSEWQIFTSSIDLLHSAAWAGWKSVPRELMFENFQRHPG